MRIILFIFSIAVSSAALAQSHSKSNGFYGSFQLGYLKGTGNIKFKDVETANSGYAVRAGVSGGYYLTSNLSAGIGWGLEGYHKPDYNLAPLFLESRYYLKPSGNSVFVQANGGYQIALSREFRKGTYAGVYGGYRIGKKRIHVVLSAGADFNQVQDASIIVYDASKDLFTTRSEDIWLKSISFNCAFEF